MIQNAVRPMGLREQSALIFDENRRADFYSSPLKPKKGADLPPASQVILAASASGQNSAAMAAAVNISEVTRTLQTRCWLKTKSDNFKEYQITLSGDLVVFSRPKSSKQQQIKYSISNFQCQTVPERSDLVAEKPLSKKAEPTACMLLINSPTQQRSVYFESRETMALWESTILRAQGFSEENRIDQFELIGKLGEGTFGIVVLGCHKISKDKFAIKVMKKEQITKVFEVNNEAFNEREILQEFSRSKNSNILELVDSFEDAENIFLVTKLMAGGDMLNYLMKQETQPLTEMHAKIIIRQVAIGVRSLHEKNIVHRDLKIENLLMADMTFNTKVRIADLGSAARLASPTATTTFKIGTPGYMAPEMLAGQAYGLPIDVFSLGCILHVSLTATPPFWEDDRKQRNERVCNEPFDPSSNQFLAGLSAPLLNLLSRMLAKDPAQRPTI